MLFLRSLPEGMTCKELKSIIRTTIRRSIARPLWLATPVRDCSIFSITDPENGSREFHGLVEIQPAKLAAEAMEALRGRKIDGKPLEVRRYYSRSRLRDRRELAAEEAAGGNRKGDRRRHNLKIELISS